MNGSRPSSKSLVGASRGASLALLACLLLLTQGLIPAAEKSRRKQPGLTELELQGMLMSYADRFATLVDQAFDQFDAAKPEPGERAFVLSDLTLASAAAFSLAAEPNPGPALLDMIVMTMLGRQIYEDILRPRFGSQLLPIVRTFQGLEADIWEIANQVLVPEQSMEIRQLVSEWRRENAEVDTYHYLRFNDFAAGRRQSTLVKRGGGWFLKSVRQAREEAEEIRMLSERAMFLATRLPLLAGNFSEVWMSQLLLNPQAAAFLDDLHKLTADSEQFVDLADRLPREIADQQNRIVDRAMEAARLLAAATLQDVMIQVREERSAAIDQLMDRLAAEREKTVRDLVREEERLTRLLSAVEKALIEGDNLVTSATVLAEKLNLGGSGEGEPFRISDYRETLVEAATAARDLNTLVESSDRLLTDDGFELLLPGIGQTIDRVGSKGQELIDRTFWQASLLVLVWMIAYVASKLLLRGLSGGLRKPETEPGGAQAGDRSLH